MEGDTLEDVPVEIQQALMRFESSGGRRACAKYATYFDNLTFKATTGADLPEPAQARTTVPGPPDDTIHVRANESPPTAAGKNAALPVEVPELVNITRDSRKAGLLTGTDW